MRLRVEAVDVARRTADSSGFLHLTNAGTPVEIVYRLWIVRTGDCVALVDTGPPAEDGRRRGLAFFEEVPAALTGRGIDPKTVERVVLTHLHWDHAGAAGLFPRARFWLQKAEADFVRDPISRRPPFGDFYGGSAAEDFLRGDRIELVEGNVELFGGLRALPLPGHTPGSQGILVPGADGGDLIVGDAAPLVRNLTRDIAPGILTDLPAALRTLDRIRGSGAHTVWFGHDAVPCMQLDGAAA